MASENPEGDDAHALGEQKRMSRSLSRKDTTSSQVAKEIDRIEQRLSQTQEKSDDISSWISEPSQPLVDPNLPLTPPSLPRDDDEEEKKLGMEADNGEEPVENVATPREAQRTKTPVVQRSPPTPDQTPPKHGEYPRSGLKVRPTPPPSIRQLSSAAQSFTTAQEQLYSQESLALTTPTQKERHETPRPPVGVGLGLGFEASEGSGTPTVRTPSVVPRIQDLDSPWDGDLSMVSDDPFVAPESIAVQQIQYDQDSPRRKRRQGAKETKEKTSISEDFQASLERELLSKDSSANSRVVSSSSSVEKAPEQTYLTTLDNTSTIHVDKKRLSAVSSQSQVVQAVVVSTPPQKRQRLRHSSKNESLRTASTPAEGSNRSSLVSSETKPRLHHQKGRITERGNRASVNSDSGISMGSDLRKKAEESLPTSEIPQRHSSLKSSKRRMPKSKQRERSGTKDHHKKRPETAPEGSTGPVFGSPSRRARADSESVYVEAAKDARGRKQLMSRPKIPQRSSSLSAPTSRNASRTTSLTSTSLHKHNLQQQNTQQSRITQGVSQIPQVEVDPPADERQTNNNLHSTESEAKRASDESSGGRHRSLLATPFSLASIQSSTPGPYEVNEATAINIYPHNNTSVLVVQQLPSRGSEQPRLSASLSGNVRINLDSFGSPTRAQRSRTVMESPLKNPREAPQPPPVVLIPPTHAQPESAPPSRGRRSATSSNNNSSTGAFQMVRRALSARRYSESFVNPVTRSFPSRSSSMKRSNRTKITPNSKPEQVLGFRRPRGFWNDLSDDDEEEEEQRRPGFIRTSIRGPGDLGNTKLVKRLGSLRTKRKPVAGNEGDDTYVSYGRIYTRPSYPKNGMTDGGYDDVERKVGIITRIRNTPRPRPFTSLQDAIKEMRHKRVEEQLERQRERLRQNIGPVILQDDARPFY